MASINLRWACCKHPGWYHSPESVAELAMYIRATYFCKLEYKRTVSLQVRTSGVLKY